MAEIRRCILCGNPLPSEAPDGSCPACMLRAGLEPDTRPMPEGSAGENVTFSFEPAQPGHVLENLARSFGPIPRVLLPETGALDTALTVTEPSTDEMPAPAERGDRYQLFGEIARGGMGAVLRARDPDLGRDLAVKVLLESHEDKPELVRRFVEEAQIGGQLQHPGIVPVYELGAFADRRPYFTMKLVKGRTLQSLVAERESPAHDLTRFLSTFEAICQTMAYAHARGVIHRDLKPSNVMVGSFGEVQVMDWGLAKVLKERGADDEPPARPAPAESLVATVRSGSTLDQSQAGSVLGTPAYMAPEQAAGETERVDRRADVFGLGSILCQILTGQPAYTGQGVTDILRKAMRGETADALARLAGCGAEAELVTLAKDCLAAEPDLRPGEASLVAARITAYRSSVQDRLRAAEVARAAETARAEEAIVRARAERRARQFQVGLAASLLLLSIAGGLTFTYWLQQQQKLAAPFAHMLAETTALRDKARRQLDDPVAWRDALAALERAADQGSSEQVQALRGEIEASLEDAERDARLRQALVEIRANAEDAGHDRTDGSYATAFRDAKLDLDALAPDEFARRLSRRRKPVVIELSMFLDDWSAARRGAGRPVAAWRRPVEAARLADPDPYRDRLRQALLAEDARHEAGTLKALAAAPDAADLPAPTAVLLGRTLADNGEAEAAVALLRPAASRHPDDVWVNHVLALALDSLGPSAREESLRYYTASRTLRPETGHQVAHLLERMGRGREAEAVLRDLVDRRPEDPHHLVCLANHLKGAGRPGEAARFLERAVASARAAIRRKPDDFDVYTYLAPALAMLGKVDEAIAEYREMIRLRPDYADGRVGLGVILAADKHDYAAAEAEYLEAIRLKPDSALAHYNLGHALGNAGKTDLAIAAFREAIRLKPAYAQAHHNLGVSLQRQGAYAEAAAMLRKARELGNPTGELVAVAEPGSAESLRKRAGSQESAVAPPNASASARGQSLAVGDRAPKLEVKSFVKGEPITTLEPGKFYVIDFWATWCAPCRTTIPHLTELQKKHVGVAFIGVSILEQDQKSVKPFVDAMGDQMAFRVAVDAVPQTGDPTEGAMAANWMKAAGLDAIPVAFIIDKSGKIAWIGHPMTIDEPLEKIVGGSWDLAAPRASSRKEREDRAKMAGGGNNPGAPAGPTRGLDEAVAELRARIQATPNDGGLYSNYGRLLGYLGRHDEAIEACRKAIELNANDGGAHYNLGMSLAAKGRLQGAVAEFGTAARLDPSLSESRQWQLRYNAACAAALAAAGKVEDEPPPDDAAKAKLRRQALEWLRAEYQAWEQVLESGPPQARPVIMQTLGHWKQQSHLAGIRDGEALARLPEAERKEWQVLWAEVDSLLYRDSLQVARKQFGPDDPRTAAILAPLGLSLIQRGKWTEAEPVLRESLAIREKVQAGDWTTFNTRSLLGGSLLGQQKYAEAEPLILAGYEGMRARDEKIPPPAKPRLTDAADRIVKLYEAWGKPEKAAEWRAKLGKPSVEANKPRL